MTAMTPLTSLLTSLFVRLWSLGVGRDVKSAVISSKQLLRRCKVILVKRSQRKGKQFGGCPGGRGAVGGRGTGQGERKVAVGPT